MSKEPTAKQAQLRQLREVQAAIPANKRPPKMKPKATKPARRQGRGR